MHNFFSRLYHDFEKFLLDSIDFLKVLALWILAIAGVYFIAWVMLALSGAVR